MPLRKPGIAVRHLHWGRVGPCSEGIEATSRKEPLLPPHGWISSDFLFYKGVAPGDVAVDIEILRSQRVSPLQSLARLVQEGGADQVSLFGFAPILKS